MVEMWHGAYNMFQLRILWQTVVLNVELENGDWQPVSSKTTINQCNSSYNTFEGQCTLNKGSYSLKENMRKTCNICFLPSHTAAVIIMFTSYNKVLQYNLPLLAQHRVHMEITECLIPVRRQYRVQQL